MKEKNEAYEKMNSPIMAEIHKGNLPWKLPFFQSGPPTNLDTMEEYRGINRIALMIPNYKENFFLTEKQGRLLGGKLIENATPHEVVYWKKVALPTLAPEDENKHISVPGIHTVYNISQFTGLQKRPEISQSMPSKKSPIKNCQSIVENMPKDMQIALPKRKDYPDVQSYYEAVFKQMINSHSHKPDRTDKEDSQALESRKLSAEIGASYLLSKAGFEKQNAKASKADIKELEANVQNDEKFFIHAAANANKETDHILNIGKGRGDNSLEKEFSEPSPKSPEPDRAMMREDELREIRSEGIERETSLSR